MNPTSVAGLNACLQFQRGPAALPLPVLERVREELLDWHGSGMSVMEMSHRSPEFESINAAAEASLRKLLGIPADYAVIFVQGGGSMQFTMAPMNLCLPGKPVDVLHTGAWTAKAIAELKKGVPHRIAASSEAEKFMRVPRPDEISLSPDASYVYLCTNNTIEGTQWTAFPETGRVPLVADMSSDIASRPHRREKIRPDLCRRAEKPRPCGRDRGDRAKGFGRARRQESADAAAVPHAHQGKIALSHAADLRDLRRRAGDGMDRSRWAAWRPSKSATKPKPSCSTTPSTPAASTAARWKRVRARK